MIELGDLVFTRPLWFIGLLVTAGLAALALRYRRTLAGWADVIEPRFMAFLRARGQIVAPVGHGGVLVIASVAMLIALALAGPSTRNERTSGFRNRDILFLLIDLSPSVTRGGALDDAKAAAVQLLAEARTRPVALALFSGEAYLVVPPTSDPAPLESTIAVLAEDTLPDHGSRPDRALELARHVLSGADARHADVIVLSDGGGAGPEADHAATVLDSEGVRVSAVYVGPAATPYGMPAPDRASLADLVAAGGGVMADARNSSDIAKLALGGDRLVLDAEERAILFVDHGRLLLWPALILALTLFRRRKAA